MAPASYRGADPVAISTDETEREAGDDAPLRRLSWPGMRIGRTVYVLSLAYAAVCAVGCDRSGEVPPAVPVTYGPPPPAPAPYPAPPTPTEPAAPAPVPTLAPGESSPTQAAVNGAAFAIPVDAPGERSSCTDRATYAIATLQAALNKGRETACSKDTDCVLVQDATGCDDGCQVGIHTSVAGKYHAFYEKVRSEVCGDYVEQGCPFRALNCARRTAICKEGVCTNIVSGATQTTSR